MDVVYYSYPVDAILYMYLGATAIVSLIIGLFIWRLLKRRDLAFWTTLVLSFTGLSFSLVWFQNASVAVFMGTLPWLINLISPFFYTFCLSASSMSRSDRESTTTPNDGVIYYT